MNFSDKKIVIQIIIIRRNVIDVKKIYMFELLVGECQKDPEPNADPNPVF